MLFPYVVSSGPIIHESYIFGCNEGPRSTIPPLWIYLEIPQDGKASLGEVEREAVACFPLASKAGQLTVDVYTSSERYLKLFPFKSRLDRELTPFQS